jgi:hypothetical protein
MREVVSEAFLRDAIWARMTAELMIQKFDFWSRPERRKRQGGGTNWRLNFNPGAVPTGYTETWERIRHEFEDRYDMADS